ncbi:uncharacterized protein LOC123977916 [Micropterus dolomieu]|uniref:uncharacterized protein LOC123977916 n=1 Tax=Micropterus dolomieu TaxID=147949 RepID=UPI001E8CAA81|nr:uncharacterized protein LOC123977916 [Micropterus dolomieu]
MSASSHQAALMVSATGTGNCFHPSSCRLSVTIRAASLTPTWAGLGRSSTPYNAPLQPTVQEFTLPSSRAIHPCRRRVPVPPTPTPPHHSLQEANTRCGSPALQQPSLQGTLHYRACFWDDEDQVPGHLPASAGSAPHLCTSRHNSMCHPPQHLSWVLVTLWPQRHEPEEDVAEDEGENGLERVSGAPWRDQLSAEVSALEEVPPDHQYF